MLLYAWVTSAFISKGSPVDHTWVTSYDSRNNNLSTILDVKKANEQYWYCRGSFHQHGSPAKPIVNGAFSSGSASCLVTPNDSKSNGTVHWYGIDGVCHQVSNQVLYVTLIPMGGKPPIVNRARGYKLSSALFGTYGRREAEWSAVRIKCGILPATILRRRVATSLLVRRMSYILNLSTNDQRVMLLEDARRRLLIELDDVGFAKRRLNESAQDRVTIMNEGINSFLRFASNSFNDDVSFSRVFGINRNEDIFLIDPSLFEFPEPSDRPERGAMVGW